MYPCLRREGGTFGRVGGKKAGLAGGHSGRPRRGFGLIHMDLHITENLELILRWAHVFAGIMWVGATYYFTWLDGRFVELEEKAKKNPDDKTPEKYVWMLHSGGFYLVEKIKQPQLLSQTLHWFKWEAGITWISGILLFT